MKKFWLLILLSLNVITGKGFSFFNNSDTTEAKKYYQLMMAQVEADSTLAVKYAGQALIYARKGGSAKIEADINNNLGVFYGYKGNYKKSDSLINKALSLRRALKDSLGTAYCLMNLGNNHYDQTDFAAALNYYITAADIRQKINDKKGLAGSYIWIGNIYYEGLINYDRAINYFLKARQLYQAINDDTGLSYVYSNLGNVYMLQRSYKTALDYFNKAIPLKIKTHSERGLGVIYNNMGNLYFNQGMYAQSMPYYSKSLAIRQQQSDKPGIATSYVNIANVQIKTNSNLPEAEALLKKAVALSTQINFLQGLRDANHSLYELSKKNGDYKSAASYLQQETVFKDSILNASSVKQINDVQLKYEAKDREQQINLLNQQNTIQKLSIGRRNIMIGTGLGIFIIALTLGALFYNRSRLKQEAKLQAEVIHQQDLASKGIIDAEERERKRIAADLHDGVGQLFSTVRLNLGSLLEKLPNNQPDNLLAEQTLALVDESCREVRTIAHQMMPNVLLKTGLASAVKDFISKIDSRKLKVSLEASGLNERLGPDMETVLYRVIQECVNNVIKHARADRLDIQLDRTEKEISVTIEDNGQGFDTNDRNKFEGIGLKNITTRLNYLRGTAEFSSSPGKGTLVAIYVPLT